jgi:plasmid maintenance system antidote protein VapI
MDAQVKKLETLLSENALEIEDFANCLGISDKQAEAFCEGKKKSSHRRSPDRLSKLSRNPSFG